MTSKELLENIKQELKNIWMEEMPKSQKGNDFINDIKYYGEQSIYIGRTTLARNLYFEIVDADVED